MAFTEKLKLEAKRKSAFRCCICHKLFVEVHHIIPSSEGGSDTLDNAAALCASCHDLFGGNPEKRKQIRRMRDAWWESIEKRISQIIQGGNLEPLSVIDEAPQNINQLKSESVAIYHNVFANEGFEETANILFRLVKEAQSKAPNQRRFLYLDIEDHANSKGGFNHDMFELQAHFILGFLMPFLSAAYLPLVAVGNNKLQRNDIPEELHILNKANEVQKW